MNTTFLTDKKLWLAPLAGITDFAFRQICKDCGADVMVSEMVSADGLIFNKNKSIIYANFEDYQRPFGIQLFGSDPQRMADATDILLEKKPDFIDINMGCPVKKVVTRNAGSALMKNPKLAVEIVSKVKKVIDIPLSVKFRAGWDFEHINAIEFGKRMADAGADIICLHPRTKSQMFSGKSNWNLIEKLKNAVKIPIIGNGDIASKNDVEKMYAQTNCNSVMLGRGVMGKPWIFREIKDNFEISPIEKFAIIKKHFLLSIEQKGEKKAIVEMRTQLHHYTKGLRNSAKIREFINYCYDKNEILKTIENLFKKA